MVDEEAVAEDAGWRQMPWSVAAMHLVLVCTNFLMGSWLRCLVGHLVCMGVIALIVGFNVQAGILGVGLWCAIASFLHVPCWVLQRRAMKALARHNPELAEYIRQFDDREREIRRRERWA